MRSQVDRAEKLTSTVTGLTSDKFCVKTFSPFESRCLSCEGACSGRSAAVAAVVDSFRSGDCAAITADDLTT